MDALTHLLAKAVANVAVDQKFQCIRESGDIASWMKKAIAAACDLFRGAANVAHDGFPIAIVSNAASEEGSTRTDTIASRPS
ncbi:hypothetical protein QA641_14325 [Bradyrhizobium sp. CB1650]|uniref:hypothetical protein n=1 Tax=Bradyrhizobium sp. CB1650 TaxID=3039153 RepID=UPI00243531D1|nr:hypothetical protein [Bradyrhizobium sp. CB1650]WGD54982.1 hypothetical protein QA641_14325 [Bradyrhizobium sp. CB1650]